MPDQPVYLDCNATTPLHPAAREAMLAWLDPARPANPGSRTHAFGSAAAKAVQHAREQVAAAAGVPTSGVIFTSGATEANNLALFGLAASDAAKEPPARRDHGDRTSRRSGADAIPRGPRV